MEFRLVGRLGQDPVLKHTRNGKAVTTLSIAENAYDFSAQEKTTEWSDITVWGVDAENACNFLAASSLVDVAGTKKKVEYIDKQGNKRKKDEYHAAPGKVNFLDRKCPKCGYSPTDAKRNNPQNPQGFGSNNNNGYNQEPPF